MLAELRTNPAYSAAWHDLNTTGGLKIYTTMNPQDQAAAQNAVNYMVPAPPSAYNPGQNAAAEVLIKPGTGAVEAIAVDRPYGTGNGQDSIDYAVDSAQNGGIGVQTGSSSKLFTLITALKKGIPFGFSLSVVIARRRSARLLQLQQQASRLVPGSQRRTRRARYLLAVHRDHQVDQRVLCQARAARSACATWSAPRSAWATTARTAAALLSTPVEQAGPGSEDYQPPADDVPSFTLGSVDVSPMTMAAAYATVAAGGVYSLIQVAINEITAVGARAAQVRQLPVASAGCHRVFSAAVAAAATYILRGVLTSGTAKGDSVTRKGTAVPQAGKTGTANSFDFAAFGGYTPRLAGFVSEFNPAGPVSHPMVGNASCYRSAGGGQGLPGLGLRRERV